MMDVDFGENFELNVQFAHKKPASKQLEVAVALLECDGF